MQSEQEGTGGAVNGAPPLVWRFALLAVAAVSTIGANLKTVAVFFYFPLGLLPSLTLEGGLSTLAFLLGWVAYISLVVLVLSAKNRRVFVFVFVLLCALLAVNTLGCRRQLASGRETDCARVPRGTSSGC
jgi:hypothetical protein